MATSKLPTYFGDLAVDLDDQLHSEVIPFEAAGVIAAGAPVALAEAGTVTESAADGSACGIAIEAAAAAGDVVRVQLAGFTEALVAGTNNAGNTAIAAGDFLCVGAVAGEMYKFTAGTDAMPHAVAVDTATSGEAVGLKTVRFLKNL